MTKPNGHHFSQLLTTLFSISHEYRVDSAFFLRSFGRKPVWKGHEGYTTTA